MPSAPLRVCATCKHVGCTRHVRPAWGHAAPPPRITGRRLQRLRLDLWAKDPRCARCRRVVAPHEMVRDHIVPLEEGGRDDETNVQVLCRDPCHNEKTKQEAERGKQRAKGGM